MLIGIARVWRFLCVTLFHALFTIYLLPFRRLNIAHSFVLVCITLYLFLSAIYQTFVRLSYFSDHFLKLKIYYGELNFEVIEEEVAYTVSICIITKN